MKSFRLSLPMRNWNCFKYSNFNKDIIVWAYLWGIEIFLTSSCFIFSHMFEPTYEELKYIYLVLYRYRSYQFEPTYEELKLGMFQYKNFLISRFEPTYEELKSGWYPYLKPVLFVWAYLWGIEIEHHLSK